MHDAALKHLFDPNAGRQSLVLDHPDLTTQTLPTNFVATIITTQHQQQRHRLSVQICPPGPPSLHPSIMSLASSAEDRLANGPTFGPFWSC